MRPPNIDSDPEDYFCRTDSPSVLEYFLQGQTQPTGGASSSTRKLFQGDLDADTISNESRGSNYTTDDDACSGNESRSPTLPSQKRAQLPVKIPLLKLPLIPYRREVVIKSPMHLSRLLREEHGCGEGEQRIRNGQFENEEPMKQENVEHTVSCCQPRYTSGKPSPSSDVPQALTRSSEMETDKMHYLYSERESDPFPIKQHYRSNLQQNQRFSDQKPYNRGTAGSYSPKAKTMKGCWWIGQPSQWNYNGLPRICDVFDKIQNYIFSCCTSELEIKFMF